MRSQRRSSTTSSLYLPLCCCWHAVMHPAAMKTARNTISATNTPLSMARHFHSSGHSSFTFSILSLLCACTGEQSVCVCVCVCAEGNKKNRREREKVRGDDGVQGHAAEGVHVRAEACAPQAAQLGTRVGRLAQSRARNEHHTADHTHKVARGTPVQTTT